jgi:hypothetical protein
MGSFSSGIDLNGMLKEMYGDLLEDLVYGSKWRTDWGFTTKELEHVHSKQTAIKKLIKRWKNGRV